MVKITDKIDDQREKVEALIWELSEWRGKRGAVDKIMVEVDRLSTMKAEFIGQRAVRVRPVDGFNPVEETDDARRLEEYMIETAAQPAAEPPETRLPSVDEKECKACGHVKSKSDFTKDRTRADGYISRCKACVKNGTRIPRL